MIQKTSEVANIQLFSITIVQNGVKCERFVIKYRLPKQINIYTVKYTCYILIKFGRNEEKR